MVVVAILSNTCNATMSRDSQKHKLQEVIACKLGRAVKTTSCGISQPVTHTSYLAERTGMLI